VRGAAIEGDKLKKELDRLEFRRILRSGFRRTAYNMGLKKEGKKGEERKRSTKRGGFFTGELPVHKVDEGGLYVGERRKRDLGGCNPFL